MLINLEEKSSAQCYHLLTNVVVPRPIAWVMTESIAADKKVLNIAPFSYFTPISSQPPAVMVSIGHKPDSTPKDTLRNLRDTKKCAICIVDMDHFEQMHLSAEPLRADESEVEALDMNTIEIIEGYPPIPAGIKVAMFGEYTQEVDLGSQTIPVIIEIKHIYADNTVVADQDKMKIEIDAIARMGGTYRTLGESVETPAR